jgi:hypothetical protein
VSFLRQLHITTTALTLAMNTHTPNSSTPSMKTLPRRKPRIPRPNHRLDVELRNRRRRAHNSLIRIPTPAQRIVFDLRSLRVTYEYQLRGGALGREGRDLVIDCLDAGLD